MTDLYRETKAAEVLKTKLQSILGDDETLLSDTLEGETSLFEAMDAAIKQIADDEMAMAGIDDFKKKLEIRAKRLKGRVENLRTSLALALEVAEKRKYDHPLATISAKATPPKAVITSEPDIPSRFFVDQPKKIDKKKLLVALKVDAEKEESEGIPGAELSNGGSTISIRWA